MSKIKDNKIPSLKDLIITCAFGKLEKVKELAQKIDNVNAVCMQSQEDNEIKDVDHFCTSPLSMACSRGKLDIVKYLVSIKADVNYVNPYRINTALNWAEDPKIVAFLLENGANIEGADVKDSWTPLQRACSMGTQEVVKLLMEYHNPANEKVVDKWGNGLLHTCIQTVANQNVLTYLVSKGLDINLTNKLGETPFYMACLRPHLNAAQYLAHKGVDINEINAKSGLTPKEIALKSLKQWLRNPELTSDDPKTADDAPASVYTQSFKSIIRFIDTWNRKDEFVKEVGDFADGLCLSNVLFQSYCSGEVMAEPSEEG